MILQIAQKISPPLEKLIKEMDFSQLLKEESGSRSVHYIHSATFRRRVENKCREIGLKIPINWDFENDWNLIYRESIGGDL
jgi:hypothetical protein